MTDDDNRPQPKPDYSRKVSEALGAIDAAFGDLSRPGRGAFKSGSRNEDVTEMLQAFGDQRWQDLDRSLLMFHREALCLLEPEAFKYYLPAYMAASLRAGPFLPDIREYTVMALRLTSGTERQTAPLTVQQKEAIRAFLRAVRSDYGALRDDPAMNAWNISD
jgi:hypothetical protein